MSDSLVDRPAAEYEVRHVSIDAPEAQPVLADLFDEYSSRYPELQRAELTRIPAVDLAPPDGTFVVVLEDGATVAGGAFRRYDGETAELKRIWTASTHRRRGLGRRVLDELETEARARGYRRIYLTTGPRQPEAKELYLATGYTPKFDLALDPEVIRQLAFEKFLASS